MLRSVKPLKAETVPLYTSAMRRVVVTGIGAVTPLGSGFTESWAGLLEGRSGISRVERLGGTHPYSHGGEVGLGNCSLSIREQKYDHFIRYALCAAGEALRDAALIGEAGLLGIGRAAVVMGSSRSGISSLDGEIRKSAKGGSARGGRTLSPYLLPSFTVSMASSLIAKRYSIRGECMGISSACASGLLAIGEAYRRVRHGYADVAIAGGADAPLCRTCVEAYGSMGALSKRNSPEASRPFDANRDGFVLSEGACVLVLEELGHSRSRGGPSYGEIVGYACSTDGYHETRPSAEGEAGTMTTAMRSAKVDPSALGLISAHATSTRLGDRIEAEALGIALGSLAATIPVTALKSMTGHMLAASGAFESSVALRALRDQVVPPTINLQCRDPLVELNIVTSASRVTADHAMVNSFGFGGINGVLILRRG